MTAPAVRVGLVQINEVNRAHRRREQYSNRDGVLVPRRTRIEPGTTFAYFPYSVGLLEAYVEQRALDPSRYEFLAPIFHRIPVAEAVARLVDADIVGFSSYVWNINLSLLIARGVKEARPEALVVFGGPQVPDHAEGFLRDHPFIDIVCHGESEPVFLQVLEAGGKEGWRQIPGVSFVDGEGTFVANPRTARVRDLAEMPSPYLSGVFDDLLRRHPDYQWIAMWETNRGCPFSCTFCDWGSAVASRINRFDMERLHAEAEWFALNRICHVFVCDANFGILPRDVDITRCLVQAYERHRAHLTISLQGAKSSTNRSYEIQRILADSTAVAMGTTLSMQSLNEPTLAAVKRSNISLEVFRELQRRYKADGIPTYSDLIVGMPGETYDSFADGVATLIHEGQHNLITFYNCSILPNAEMGDPEYQRRHGIEYVRVRIVHAHEALDSPERNEVPEFLNTVTATSTMSRDDWCRARMFADMASLLHFDRVLQIAFVVAAEHYGVGYRELIEAVLHADEVRFPICAEVRAVFAGHARAIQRGEPEYLPSPDWLHLWWPADQYALVKLVVENKLGRFYDEAEQILLLVLAREVGGCDEALVRDAILLNQAMLRVPNEYDDIDLQLSHNVLEFYRAAVAGAHANLERRPSRYIIDRTSTAWLSWRAWAVDVTAQMYSPEAFLYRARALEPAEVALPAGHAAG